MNDSYSRPTWFGDTHYTETLGLTDEDVIALVRAPFDSPDLVVFPEVLDDEPSAPILDIFNVLVLVLRDSPLELTGKGDLPDEIVSKVADECLRRHYQPIDDALARSSITHESDYPWLYATRKIALAAELFSMNANRLALSGTFHSTMSEHGIAGVYPRLLRAFLERVDWEEFDRYIPWPGIQSAWALWAYVLTMLGESGDIKVLIDSYEVLVRRAFSLGVIEAPNPEVDFHGFPLYVRLIDTFCMFMGLGEHHFMIEESLTSSSTLNDAMRFRF